MADWRVARSLDQLLDQINAMAPNRSKVSDGSIGDEAHRARRSDHNPDSAGVVRARDYTHDPAHSADMAKIAEALRRSRDRRVKYVIWNRRSFSGHAGDNPWTWRTYSGSNPHDHHMHVSVVPTTAADDTTPWQIGDDDMPTLDEIRTVVREQIKAELNGAFYDPGHLNVPAGTTRPGVDWNVYLRTGRVEQCLTALRGDVAAALGRDPVNEQDIVDGVLAGLGTKPAADIAAALRAALTPEQVAEVIAALTGG